MEPTRLKGIVVRDLHQALADVAGEDALRAVIAGFPERDRQEYEEAIGTSWVRIALVEQVLEAVALRVGRDVVALNRDVNRIAADRSVKTLARLILKLASPKLAITRAASVYGRAYDRGRVTVHAQEGKAVVELRERPGMSGIAREGFAIAVETVLRHTGAGNVRVISAGHPDGADYTVTWRP
jgi:hypothetical protein